MEIKTRKQAKADGDTLYYTGKPCKYGHDAPRYVSDHRCKTCKQNEFRRWAAANPEKVKEKDQKWYWDNRDYLLEYMKEYRENNREYMRELSRDYQRRHPEKTRERKKKHYYENQEYYCNKARIHYYANREHNLVLMSEWRKKNRANKNAYDRERHALKLNAMPSWVDEDEKFLIQEAYNLSQQRTEETGFEWNVDHIVPLKSKIVCGLHCWENLQVIPTTENNSKGNKFDPEDHYWRRQDATD